MIQQGPTPKEKQVIKNGRSKNNPRHKKPKVHSRTYRPISRSRQMHKQQAKKVKHAQDLGTTNLYPTNIGSGGSWVRGKRGHGLTVGREKTYSGVFAQALLEEMSCWDNMPPKRSKDELEPLDACYKG